MANVTSLELRRSIYIKPSLPGKLKLADSGAGNNNGIVHKLALALVWLAVASSAIVFSEPAPTDVLTMAAIVVLPVVGLAVLRPPLLVLGAGLLMICAFGYLAALYATDTGKAVTHMTISLYLSLAAVVLGAFVARNPANHTRLVLRAYLFGALIAAMAAIIGYFDLLPGTHDLFTKFDRASGPFKDPNVFGPFLIAPLVYAVHVWLSRPFLRGLPVAGVIGVLSFGILLSFSRAAWAGAALAIILYLYLTFVTTRRNLDRLRIAALAFAGVAAIVAVLAVALQMDQIADLLSQRASLTQSYDVGPEGRFGGQTKAMAVLLEHPWGIGALEFPERLHHEDVHNVYLSMFLNTGWGGGLLFILVSVMTLVLGFRHALGCTRTQGYFLIVLAALTATVLQGLIVDTDHWRHLYALLGMSWALMAADQRRARAPRIVGKTRALAVARALAATSPVQRRDVHSPRTPRQVIELKSHPLASHLHRNPHILGPAQTRRPSLLRPAAGPEITPRQPNLGNTQIIELKAHPHASRLHRLPRILGPVQPRRPARLLNVNDGCALPTRRRPRITGIIELKAYRGAIRLNRAPRILGAAQPRLTGQSGTVRHGQFRFAAPGETTI